MYKRIALITIMIFLLLTACAPAARNEAPAMEGGMTGSEMPVAESEMARGSDMAFPEEMPAAQDGSTNGDRIVLRNASMTIIVPDPAQAMTTISQMAEGMGGFVVSSNLYKTWSSAGVEVPEASVTVRVPAERLNEALGQIRGLVTDPDNVKSENISGQDVTAEYTDLSSRLRNLQAAEEQLREIMEDANRTEDVLAVHSQLTQIRSEIEVIQGQIRYYDEAASLSSIAVQIQAEAAIAPIEVGGWKPAGIARDAIQALLDTFQFLGSALIWIVIYVLPVAIILFLFFWLVWRVLRGLFRRKPQNPQPPAAPPAL